MKRFPFVVPAVLSLCLASRVMAAPAPSAPQFLDDDAEAATDVAFDLKPAATGSLSLVFDWRDAKNFYSLDIVPGSVAMRSTINGVTHRLNSASLPLTPNHKVHVVLQRRPWLMRALIDRRAVLTAYDATFQDGRIGFVEQGFASTEARVQPVESIVWDDDFTRLAGQSGDWQADAGDWALTSSSDSISQNNADMSANPFSYRATPQGNSAAFAHAGRWFWDAYDAGVSVRPMGRGTIGLAVYVQDAKNYIAFEWDAAESASARRLVRVVNGARTILAQSSGSYMPRQWYRLQASVSPGWVEAGVDGKTLLRARDDWFGQGGIGLLCKGTPAFWDDARARSNSFYRQDFTGPTGGAWSPVGGAWRAQGGVLTSSRAVPSETERLLLAGRGEWTGYEFAARGTLSPTTADGLILSYVDPQNYALFRWAGAGAPVSFKGRQQLVVWRGGKAQVVSNEPLTLQADKDGMTRVMGRLDAGALTIYGTGKTSVSKLGDDMRPVAQAADESLGAGRCGLWAQGAAPADFRDVSVAFPPEPEAPHAAARMQGDSLMTGWASPSGEWRAQPVMRQVTMTDGTAKKRLMVEFWNASEFFGNTSLELPWKRGLYNGGVFEATLRAARGDFDSGLIVRGEPSADNSALTLSIRRGSTTFKTATVTWKALGIGDGVMSPSLKISLEGRALSISIGGKPALAVLLPSNALSGTDGSALATRATGFLLAPGELRATSYQRDDDTFTSAPVGWTTAGGEWSIISRWPCYSDWSFFGGKGIAPTLWSKRVYAGDVVAEIYAHNQMDLPKETGYSHPGDLNVTLCGDGKNLWSGYQFVVAGWENTRTRLYRGTQMVAETTAPAALFHRTMNQDMGWHRHWFDVRAEARRVVRNGQSGVLLQLTMDDQPLLEYFDPQPLNRFGNGGRTAFWSVDGSLILARARIEAREMGEQSLPSGLLSADASSGSSANAPEPLAQDGSPATLITAKALNGTAGWEVHNLSSGGTFGVVLPLKGEVGPKTTIQLDLKLSPDDKIDLYPIVDGQLRCIQLTGGTRADARAPSLGQARGVSLANGWTRYEFALGSALQSTDPDKTKWTLDGAQLGALHGDAYRWTGLAGNPYGASYQLLPPKLSTAS